MNVRSLGKRLNEIKEYKNRPIYLYCSHSQRSRVSSKLLIDSGFTNVTNINGGLTYIVHQQEQQPVCFDQLYETSNKFRLRSPTQVAQMLSKKNKIFVLDIRTDSVFRGISKDVLLNYLGKIDNAVNIPAKELESRISELPKNKTILVVDDNGDESDRIARMLTEKGFTDVVVLFDGLANWISEGNATLSLREKVWKRPSGFEVLSQNDFHAQLTKNTNTVIVDIRPAVEFNNEEKENKWLNRGRIKNAVNIPTEELKTRMNELDQSKDIVVYGFSSSSRQYEAAKILSDAGFKHIKVLHSGIWGLISQAANLKGKTHLREYVVDIPEENL